MISDCHLPGPSPQLLGGSGARRVAADGPI